jgi:hypothetical protein
MSHFQTQTPVHSFSSYICRSVRFACVQSRIFFNNFIVKQWRYFAARELLLAVKLFRVIFYRIVPPWQPRPDSRTRTRAWLRPRLSHRYYDWPLYLPQCKELRSPNFLLIFWGCFLNEVVEAGPWGFGGCWIVNCPSGQCYDFVNIFAEKNGGKIEFFWLKTLSVYAKIES